MNKRLLVISSCRNCYHLSLGREESTDGWDVGRAWRCERHQREIDGFVERGDPQIPDWCELPLQDGSPRMPNPVGVPRIKRKFRL